MMNYAGFVHYRINGDSLRIPLLKKINHGWKGFLDKAVKNYKLGG